MERPSRCTVTRAELFRDLPGGHALRLGLDKQPEHFQAVFLCERGQSHDGI
jgi:hypothetical protein